MVPMPTGAVLLTDDPSRTDVNEQFCIAFFASTPDASSAIAANQNVVQIFWPTTAAQPVQPPKDKDAAALSDWCTNLVGPKGTYDYGRAHDFLKAIGQATSLGPVFVAMASGDLRHPSMVIDGSDIAAPDKAADFATAITQSVATASSSPSNDQHVEQAALLDVAAAKRVAAKAAAAKKAPASAGGAASCKSGSLDSTLDRKNNGYQLTTVLPPCLLGAGSASTAPNPATPAVPVPVSSPDAFDQKLNFISADTNPTMRKACDIADDLLPLLDDIPGVKIAGDVFTWGVCDEGVRKLADALRRQRLP